MSGLAAVPYEPSMGGAWDGFVRESLNGTFLHERPYMDYHADRYRDGSLVFERRGRIEALLPANRDGEVLCSHAGLTYGGLVVGRAATAARVLEMFEELRRFCARQRVRTILYKTIPGIYHMSPADEDLYALFRLGASLYRRDLLTVLPPHGGMVPRASRRQRMRSAGAATDDERVHAGVVVFETRGVDHAQYMATDGTARRLGLLDLVVQHALERARARGRWFDFGASTEDEGRVLNPGLVQYKESFGGRAVVHDFYRLAV